MSGYRNPKESKGQIDAFAYKVLRRLHGLGAKSHTLEDVQQELWMAWCLACESFDDKGGASFKTYLYRGMQRHINRYVEKNFERFHGETVALSLDTQQDDGEGDIGTLGETIAGDYELQDQIVEREQNFRYAMSRLSPRAQEFVRFLKDTPADIQAEVKKLEAKAKHAKEMGIAVSMPQRLTSNLLLDFMAASRSERAQIMMEVEQIGQLISGAV